MLKEAAPLIEEESVKISDQPEPRRDKALLLALQDKHREAQIDNHARLPRYPSWRNLASRTKVPNGTTEATSAPSICARDHWRLTLTSATAIR
jgi:hypothetical protein